MTVTINTIAEKAGVSRGTVDRVLNDRPHVKPEIRKRVQDAIDELNYKPNKLAKALVSRKKPLLIGVVSPTWVKPFFDEVNKGILAAQEEFLDYGMKVKRYTVSNINPAETIKALDDLARKKVNGIAISTMNTEQIVEKVNQLVDQGIVVVTFNSDLPSSNRICFVGQDLYKSGRVAAGLMAKLIIENSKILVTLGNFEYQAQRDRYAGFMDRMKELKKNVVIVESKDTFDNYQITYDLIKASLRDNPDIQGIYMVAENVLGCVDAVKSVRNDPKIHIICNDMLQYTRQLLENGDIDFTISQDPFTQGYKPIRILFDKLLSNITPEKEIVYTDTSIFTFDNL